ncbi:hypothetical protein [Actinomadura roseirufa]|uniref:hypothetical protein n=1 Tax=Actinomadura roseirufa TaxID=2094049 RepID=UPI001041500A|nr:hypothetical protein [Actinomadura roseirufa]
MGPKAKRGVAAAGTVVLAALTNVTTGMLTQKWDLAWWAFTGVVVLVGGGLQAWLTVAGGPAPTAHQNVRGTKVTGSVRQTLNRPGTQEVTDSEIGADLDQRQDG